MTKLYINVNHGSAFVSDADKARALDAAEAKLSAFEWHVGNPQAIDAYEAYAAFERHWSDEDYIRSTKDTMLIAAWGAAITAANAALVQDFNDPNGAACELRIYLG